MTLPGVEVQGPLQADMSNRAVLRITRVAGFRNAFITNLFNSQRQIESITRNNVELPLWELSKALYMNLT